ncbi:TPA: NUDIX hydrolase [Candidatus Scatousia excrementigallinarum]|uniref:NUDIX hydrolase n=1 Tax=Candidatus Scatousia excrementigallinarum TaxID=2840935 RepID=A0A9D1EX19_9BACT|nr:NUDIX hydrolase [Candidatus Scatousia excrementigallinarum]
MFNETKTHEITVDVVILTIINNAIQVLLVKRLNEPFKDKWAIPGGYVRLSENLDQAALRVLKERTNVDNIYLEQLYTFGDPLRHPNARVITCAYFALVRAEDIKIVSSPELGWHKVSNLPPLAFDHKEIIEYSLKRTRERLEICPVCYQLLNEKFTLTEMQKSYELIMEKKLDKRNFRKKALATAGLSELDEYTKSSSKRPARLYTFENIQLNSKRAHFISNKKKEKK